MTKFWTFLSAWIASHEDEDEGATMVEYGLLVSLIAVVVIAALLVLGPAIRDLFNSVANSL